MPICTLPEATRHYSVHCDSWYRGVNGKKISYTKIMDAFDLAQAEQFVKNLCDPKENPRIMFEIRSGWLPIDVPCCKQEIEAREERGNDDNP